MPEHPPIIQFVGFETSLPREAFIPRWAPFAASFLARGIERVVLGESGGVSGFRFVSRNVWPEARFREVFSSRLPGDAGGGGVTAVQAGAFRIVTSEKVTLRALRGDVIKWCVLARCRHDSPGSVVPLLVSLGREHGAELGWATYAADPDTRGGRFHAALEVYATEDASAQIGIALKEAMQRNSTLLEETRVQRLREVLALP